MTSEAATAAALSAVLLQVNPENVLEVRRVVLDAARRLKTGYTQNLLAAEYVGLCGGDPVSEQAQVAFSDRIAQISDSLAIFGNRLEETGRELSRLARSYGYTDADMDRSFSTLDDGGRR